MNQPTLQGLTAAEVAERMRLGQVNRTPRSEWRAYASIFSRNLLTWFNAMVAPAAVALIALEQFPAGIAVSGMAIVNSAIGLVQEIRSKHHLDKLAILVETKARVLRDGQVQSIPASDVVLGDAVLIQTGDTIVADGPVLESSFLEVDEALLTGESDPVRRVAGEPLLSGSFCVAGEGAYRAEKVGQEAFASHTSTQARAYKYAASPLTRIINLLVQILSYTAIGLCLLYLLAYAWQGFPLDGKTPFVLRIAATITSMVPQGLVLTATVSFTLGAVHMSSRGAIVQRLNAVETMAAIDVVCTDKTGTLTTNRLKLDRISYLTKDWSEAEIRRRLSLFANLSVDRQNKNLQALRTALGEASAELLDQLPFKSQNRYSALHVRDAGQERLLVLGAPEALTDRVRLWACESGQGPSQEGANSAWEAELGELQKTGLRILLFTEGVPALAELPFARTPALPLIPLQPLALVCLSDELRPEAGQVLEALAAQGIAFKVISGDNPETVRATVSHLNLPLARDPVVTGEQLRTAPDAAELIRTRSVFGRVSPEQKVSIVATLQQQGCHVAMIGDGVNDVLPIKRADLGIAMGEGSQASKTVSGLVLENNNFALLPETLAEGRTIVRNLRRSGKLFLVKNVYSLILILAYYTGWFGFPFPYVPQQVTLLNWLVIGIPAFVIALSRERSTEATHPRFLREVGWFALRTGVVFGLAGLVILFLGVNIWTGDEKTQRTLLLSTLILLGLTALFRALKDGETQPLVGDRRFRLLGMMAVPVYLLAMYWPVSARFFELAPLSLAGWGLVLAVAGAGYGLSLATDRLGSLFVYTSRGQK